MRRWQVITSVVLLALMLFAVNVDARRLEPMKVYADSDDYVTEGDLWELYVTVDNDESSARLDDVKVRVMIPELGVYYTSSEFDVSRHSVRTKTVAVDMDNVDEGSYNVFIFVSNDDFSRAKHRVVTVN